MAGAGEGIAQTMIPILAARDVVKDFPGARALDGVTFECLAGRVHCLVGENGAGKSTLINVLSGVYPTGSYQGQVMVDGKPVRFGSTGDAQKAGIAVIRQELSLVEHMNAAENIFLNRWPIRFMMIDRHRMEREAAVILSRLGLGIDPRTPVSCLPMGARQMLEIAKALSRKSRVLVLDEPTSALSGPEIGLLLSIVRGLRAEGVAIVYISHKLGEVFELADRITVLRDGRAVAGGDVSEWNRDSVIRAMVGREIKELFPRSARKPGRVVLAARDLAIAGRACRPLRRVSFEAREGEVLGIAGLMGSGRTELLSAVFGSAREPWSGTVEIDGVPLKIGSPRDAIRAEIALVPEDRRGQGLAVMLSLLENLTMAHLGDFTRAGVVDEAKRTNRAGKIAGELAVKSSSLNQEAGTLSGGNQQKAVLAKWLIKRPRVLLLDEPTRGIDVGAKSEIYRLIDRLAASGMAIVIVSSELPELLGLADRVLVMNEGEARAEFPATEADSEKIMRAAT